MYSCTKDPVVPAYVAPDSSYGLIYNKIFTPSCALAGCHANESHDEHAHAVTLEGSSTYTNIINGKTKNIQAAAANLLIIMPGDTSRSFLYQKLIYNRSVHKYGAPMPSGGLTISDKKIEFVKQWIQAGAPLDGHVADKSLLN